jgi:hypothetical protein
LKTYLIVHSFEVNEKAKKKKESRKKEFEKAQGKQTRKKQKKSQKVKLPHFIQFVKANSNLNQSE